ncbi:MAG: RluA family pseudouridine synthase [Phycisphaerae bacterium]|nr:RluA family pseudouridine synthase [Phycisphaerae bacterium]
MTVDPDDQPPESVPEADAEDSIEEDGAEHASVLVRKDLTNRRLDQYLPSRFPRFSRSAIQRLIEAGAVTVNGQPVKASRKLCPGDVVDVVLPPPQPKEILPEPIPLDVIWEDEYLLAVNKQAGVLVHPARGNPHGTLVNGLVFYAGQLAKGSDPFRPGIIHRLDRDTTGIMLVAKTDEALWRMSRQFEARRIHKEYLAIVHGRLDLSADRIDAPLARHRHVRERFAVDFDNPQAKAAMTTWRVLERFRGFTLIQLEPKTGRTHQLRVHMSFIKHPIVGDKDYGGRKVTRADLTRDDSPSDRLRAAPEDPLIRRQALHAHRLQFRHPITGTPMELIAPPAADFQSLLDALRELRSS